ncbi:MAG: hypothetical protein B7Z73_07770 [Planctomycetia bacterium 21-64-5]|nr:MAG: hypothetical protein B7Z73_07770 [Planctomycetia bacterium 21-64-5]HQU43240.1 helix-turn-helix domain-containing protein [Pirellulales bacterium]
MATSESPVIQTVVLGGERFVILPEAEFARLQGEPMEPELPAALPDGNYPAVETARLLLARDLIRSRRALGWSQAELARRAGVRVETLDRLERGTHSPNVAIVDKLDRALKASETRTAPAKRSARKAVK